MPGGVSAVAWALFGLVANECPETVACCGAFMPVRVGVSDGGQDGLAPGSAQVLAQVDLQADTDRDALAPYFGACDGGQLRGDAFSLRIGRGRGLLRRRFPHLLRGDAAGRSETEDFLKTQAAEVLLPGDKATIDFTEPDELVLSLPELAALDPDLRNISG